MLTLAMLFIAPNVTGAIVCGRSTIALAAQAFEDLEHALKMTESWRLEEPEGGVYAEPYTYDPKTDTYTPQETPTLPPEEVVKGWLKFTGTASLVALSAYLTYHFVTNLIRS